MAPVYDNMGVSHANVLINTLLPAEKVPLVPQKAFQKIAFVGMPHGTVHHGHEQHGVASLRLQLQGRCKFLAISAKDGENLAAHIDKKVWTRDEFKEVLRRLSYNDLDFMKEQGIRIFKSR